MSQAGCSSGYAEVGSSFGAILNPLRGGVEWCTPSAAEMAALDDAAIAAGTPARDLMERAGAAVVQRITQMIPQSGVVVVLCGPGNNGGDGLVVARLLTQAGFTVSPVLVAARRYSRECLAQVELLSQLPGPRQPHLFGASSLNGEPLPAALTAALPNPVHLSHHEISRLLAEAAVVVDALLGTGQRTVAHHLVTPHAAPASAEPIPALVQVLSSARRQHPRIKVVAVDIPTGVDGDTGSVSAQHIQADLTVTFECCKRGMLQFPARSACGRIEVAPIGLTPNGSDCAEVEFRAVQGLVGLPVLPPRRPDAHKGDLGRVLVIGGSAAMPGAAVLAALGALHAGAGVVTRVTRSSWPQPEAPAECMNLILPGAAATLEPADLSAVMDGCARADVVVVGPGVGLGPAVAEFLRQFIEALRRMTREAAESRGPAHTPAGGQQRVACPSLVVDADALTCSAAHGIQLAGLPVVITPHPGEAKRLLGDPPALDLADRFTVVRELARRWGVVALLKGAGTLVHDGSRGVVVARGTPYLATAGSGDVLSGVIAALLPRVATAHDAAVLGAYVHACAGERAAARSGGPIRASEVAAAVAAEVGGLERLSRARGGGV